MKTRMKRWTQLGLSAALAGGVLAACDTAGTDTAGQGEAGSAQQVAAEAPAAATAGEGEAGLAGEGEGGEGEGGVSIAAAASDPVVYRAALAIAEAHILAARDAYAEGEVQAAGEMFAHPVSEVLYDLQPVLQAQGVDDFTPMLTEASYAVFDGETVEQIKVRADEIVAVLRTAAEKAPASDRSEAAIAAGVVADQIERATDMYRAAAESDRYEPYLDGYGFYHAARAVFAPAEAAIAAEDERAANTIRASLALLEAAYPTAVRPAGLDADQSALTVAASEVILAVNN